MIWAWLFRWADDILDATGSEEDTGKSVGQDAAAGKSTFVSILGLDQAREQAAMLARQAADHLDIFENRGGRFASIGAICRRTAWIR